MFAEKLAPDQYAAVLKQLRLAQDMPDLRMLDRLVSAYVRTVPWESAFRIVKRSQTEKIEHCSRWPEEFWHDHLTKGAGGTCFESNYAFSSILHSMGYDGYLTINDMGDSIGCHTAIIVLLQGNKWLVDVGFPIYAPLPVSPNDLMHRETPFYDYTIRPEGSDRYQIERQPHPNWVAFTLIDHPVSEHAYREATTLDYGPNGHFLKRVIIHKILNELPWRYTGDEEPAQFTCFEKGKRIDHPISGDVAAAVAAKFDLDEKIVRQAMALVRDNKPDAG